MTNHLSLSQRLHEDLKQIISKTDPGGRLTPEPQLAKELGVSRATLREAMRTFEVQGLIQRRQGSGTYVMRPAHVIATGLEVLESIETISKRSGLQVTLGKLKVEENVATEEEARELGIDIHKDVLKISRVIFAENRPVAFLVDTLPQSVITKAEIEKDFKGSILDMLMQQDHLNLAHSRTEIGAVAANQEMARALNIQRGNALLRLISWLFTVDGKVVDYSFSYFLPGYFRFHVVRELGR
ncbi:MAG: GntR family transcriptional regulator [Anaerolineales bacterium]